MFFVAVQKQFRITLEALNDTLATKYTGDHLKLCQSDKNVFAWQTKFVTFTSVWLWQLHNIRTMSEREALCYNLRSSFQKVSPKIYIFA